MSGVTSRLSGLLGHLTGSPAPAPFEHRFNHHTLSPTFFLPRAAAIEPNVGLPILPSRETHFETLWLYRLPCPSVKNKPLTEDK